MISYMNECELSPDETRFYNEEDYPFLIQELMIYIENIKKKDQSLTLIDIIEDYGLKYKIDMDTLGDAIANDTYFKAFIAKDYATKDIEPDEW